MIARMSAAVIGGLISVIKIVFLAVLVISAIGWAKTHPVQAQELFSNAMDTLAKFIDWALAQINSWLS